MKVSIVIPTWKGRRLLEKYLPEVMRAVRFKGNKIGEVIVVDDASPDDSNKFLEENYPEVRIVRHEKNRGFAAAVNSGVRVAKGDLVCLLNVDVSPSEDFLVAVLGHFKNKNVFGVSLCEKGYLWAKGWFENGFIQHGAGERKRKAHISFWVSGGSGVFRKAVWEELGGMDDELFSPFYWEDVDLSYRAAKRGYELWWEPRAKVVHEHESIISPNFPRNELGLTRERNRLFFMWKNLTSRKLLRQHVWGVIRRILVHPGYLRVVVVALGRLPAVVRARWREKKEARVSDEEILARFT